jgi:hypothetical protein
LTLKTPTKLFISFNFFRLLLFEGYLHHFSKIKVIKKSQNSGE